MFFKIQTPFPFILHSFLLISTVCSAFGDVITYPGPSKELQSPYYEVSITQSGITKNSFVYYSKNRAYQSEIKHSANKSDNWTTFSFSETIHVRVTRPGDKPIGSARILPSRHHIGTLIQGTSVNFVLSKPGQFFVEIDGDDQHPLFIFANPPESDIPSDKGPHVINFGTDGPRTNPMNQANIIYFPPGEWNLVKMGYSLSGGYPVNGGDIVYIAGGAVVYGTFVSRGGDNIQIRGRGIISGRHWDTPKNNGGWSYSKREVQIEIGKGRGHYVEGVTLADATHFGINIRTGASHIENVKILGTWWFSTDGIDIGEHGKINNCFIKPNDDGIKLYSSHTRVHDIIFWHSVNGGMFQLNWNESKTVTNLHISDCDIIHSDAVRDRIVDNNAIINMVDGRRKNLRDNLFERITVEGNTKQLLGLKGGNIDGLTLRDITVTGKCRHPNYLQGNYKNITFENLWVDGKYITSSSHFKLQGSAANLQFKKTGSPRLPEFVSIRPAESLPPLIQRSGNMLSLNKPVSNVYIIRLNGQRQNAISQNQFQWQLPDTRHGSAIIIQEGNHRTIIR